MDKCGMGNLALGTGGPSNYYVVVVFVRLLFQYGTKNCKKGYCIPLNSITIIKQLLNLVKIL